MPTIEGTAGDDTLEGTGLADVIRGLRGDDSLFGFFGADVLFGGAGDDILEKFDDEAETFYGGAGFDTFHAGTGNIWDSRFDMQSGVFTRNGIDTLVRGIEAYVGSRVRDTVVATADLILFDGGDGDDRVVWTGGDMTLIGGEDFNSAVFIDLLDFGDFAGDIVLDPARGLAEAATARLTIDGFEQYRATGAARVVLREPGTATTIETGSGDDLLTLGAGADTAITGAGRDVIRTGGGDDSILAGDGADRIFGGAGDASVDSGAGNDLVVLGPGRSSVLTGDGDDRVRLIGPEGGPIAGTAAIDTGEGDDRIVVEHLGAGVDAGRGDDVIVLRGSSGAIRGEGGRDILITEGNVRLIQLSGIEVLRNDGGSATLELGDNAGMQISLGGGIDEVSGGAWSTIHGGEGSDRFSMASSGGSADAPGATLIGGEGNDRFERGLSRFIEEGATILGQAGRDFVSVRGFTGEIFGGTGRDEIVLRDVPGSRPVLVHGGADDDYIQADNAAVLWGDGGDDDLSGGVRSTVHGGTGDDVIGLGANSTGHGDAGDDLIFVAATATAYGGDGADLFRFQPPQSGLKTATVADFQPDLDRLYLARDVAGLDDLDGLRQVGEDAVLLTSPQFIAGPTLRVVLVGVNVDDLTDAILVDVLPLTG